MITGSLLCSANHSWAANSTCRFRCLGLLRIVLGIGALSVSLVHSTAASKILPIMFRSNPVTSTSELSGSKCLILLRGSLSRSSLEVSVVSQLGILCHSRLSE